jgi:FtsZ-binding cell division protein ZapB
MAQDWLRKELIVSEGTNLELAMRDLGIEIEKLIEDRNRLREDWKAMIRQIEDLEHQNKRLRRKLADNV